MSLHLMIIGVNVYNNRESQIPIMIQAYDLNMQ